MKKAKAITKPENVCMKCLCECSHNIVKEIYLGGLGYGSAFDNFGTKIVLCSDCFKNTPVEWWKLKIIKDIPYEGCESYQYEDEILEYIKRCPIEGRELFYNRFSQSVYGNMKSQDWIDYELDELPHEKCKKYQMYSPEERQAYKDRFHTCGQVYKKVYGDGSSTLKCKRGARGYIDEKEHQTQTQCYMCDKYIPKTEAMRIINDFDEFIKREERRLLEMIKYATLNLSRIKDNPSKYYDDNN